MELSEILDELKDRFEIDVPALQLSAAESQGQEEPDSLLIKLSALFVGNGLLELSGGQESVDEAQLLIALSAMATKAAKAEELEAKALATEVDSLVLSGHILPAQRDVMLGLAGTSYDTFKALIPPKPIVALSAELGVAPDTDEAHKTDIDTEIARYGELANQVRKTK